MGIEIEFDNPTKTFYAGKVISGSVIVRYEYVMIKKISLYIVGYCHIDWNKSGGFGYKRADNKAYQTQAILNHCIILVCREPEYETYELSSEPQVFEFHYTLPKGIASSWEGKYGRTRYFVKAVVEIDPFGKYYKEEYFKVSSILDLNTIPAAKESITIIAMLYVSCCYCYFKSKPIIVAILSSRSGFVPGEILSLQIHVTNKSNVSVKEIEIRLCQYVNYCGSFIYPNKSLWSYNILKDTKLEGLSGRTEKIYGVCFQIGNMEPSTENGKIRITYGCETEIHFNKCHRKAKIEIPLYIGTIPIKQDFTYYSKNDLIM